MKISPLALLLVWLPSASLSAASPAPVGQWDFNDTQNLLKATAGKDLKLQGQHLSVPGIEAGDKAARIGVGSYYICEHGVAPVSPARLANRFSLLFDIRISSLSLWYCLFQTDTGNTTDGDLFIRPSNGNIGVGTTGYSTAAARVGSWQRIVVTVDNASGIFRIYQDGTLILNGNGQAVDGRFGLAPTLLLFADEDGEDGSLDVTRVAAYNTCLTQAEVAELGGVTGGGGGTTNAAPTLLTSQAGPPNAAVGTSVTYSFTAIDPESAKVQVQVDWGDGTALSAWSALAPSGTSIPMTHIYDEPGTWFVRALPRDELGGLGSWTQIQSVTVTGLAHVEFRTLPYLQDLRQDGLTIMWELDKSVDATIDVGLDTTYGKTVTATREASGGGTYVYRSVLGGLAPGTRYVYRCRAGTQEQTGSFVTAPATEQDFAFSVWGDSQGSNHSAYTADPLEPTKSMMRHMAATGINIGVTVGDLAESGYSYSDVRQYYLDRVAAFLGRTVPWFVAWGNHDGSSDSLIRLFADQPSKNRPGFSPGYGSYSFDYAGCHFICLDNSSRGEDILNWLEQDLQSDANRNARFTFVFIHVPPYCELWIDGDGFNRDALVPLMEAYGVDICFSGHTHEYSRGYLNGVYYCITGGGSWLDFPEVLVADWPHMTVGGQHAIPGITKPGPERGGGLINEYVRIDVRSNSFTASMIGFRPDGTEVGVLDQFSKTVGPNSNPPSAPAISGPAAFNVFSQSTLVLTSSAFSDPDGGTHMQSTWRLCRTTNVQDSAGVVLQGVTDATTLSWSIPSTNLGPGRTLYATVRHVSTDGQSSAFATPIAIRLTPEPIYVEDFESTPEFGLPAGWVATHRTATNDDLMLPDDPQSNLYLTWTVVTRDRLANAFGANRVNVPDALSGKSIYAESDQRTGVQLQYLTTPDFNLSGVSNVVLMFRNNYMQNQDSMGALECSTNGGASWGPVVYFLDTPDVILNTNGVGVDGYRTFTRVDDSGVPTADGRNASGGTYGEHILSRPFDALGAFVSARANDSLTDSKRWEQFRLGVADNQARVRFRFALVGTASWFWGVDDFSLYGQRAAEPPLRFTRISRSAGGLDLEWTGPDGPYVLQVRSDLGSGSWQDLGAQLPATQRTVHVDTSTAPAGFLRLKWVR